MEESERRVAKISCSESDTVETAPATSSAPSDSETDTNRDTEEDIGAKLDVCSDKFDPLLALYSPTVPLPYPNIKCFNNISEYESFLKGGRGRAKPENVEKRLRKANKGVADPERIERLKKLMIHNAVPEEGEGSGRCRKQQRTPKNVLTRMALHKGSPLGELHRCIEEKIRVKVHIRTFKGLRGVCSGFIVAFDKFWNMAMVDVDETYREPLLGEALYHEKALTVTRLFDKLKLQESSEMVECDQKREGKKKTRASVLQPETQKPSTTSLPPQATPRSWDRGIRRGTCRTDGRPSEATAEAGQGDGPKALVKALETGQRAQKTGSQPYGRVHSRHVNQLFIRGENVLLVNLQPV
ncbi:U7 snRNA-associated Sm-like protein LSm11 [Aplochiton taeniatus]